jgi:hypothetical protein
MRSNRTLRRLLAVICTVAAGAISLTASNPAAAQALFQPATSADLAAAAAQQPTPTPLEIRSQVVRINASVLARHLAPAGADLASDRVARANRLDGVVTLNLFPDVTATFGRVGVTEGDGGGYIWEGQVKGKAFYEALLLVRDGEVFGRVQLFNKIFRIDRLGNGVVRITELDQYKFPAPSEPVVPPRSGSLAPQPQSLPDDTGNSAALTKTTIRVLVAYTTKMRTEAGGATHVADEIATAIASANQAYARGAIPIKLQLAGSKVVTYNEGNDVNYGTNLNDLANGSSFAAVRTMRDTVKADLVSLFRAGPDLNNCPCQTGLAFLPGNTIMPTPSAMTKSSGFSVIGHKGIFDFVFQHELGHNFGLNHDRYTYTNIDGKPNPSNANYNFGYTNLTAKFYTIMAYYVQCENAHPGQCAHVNYFSSPTVKAMPGNVTIGKAKGTAGAADNTLRMKQNYSGVAVYE